MPLYFDGSVQSRRSRLIFEGMRQGDRTDRREQAKGDVGGQQPATNLRLLSNCVTSVFRRYMYASSFRGGRECGPWATFRVSKTPTSYVCSRAKRTSMRREPDLGPSSACVGFADVVGLVGGAVAAFGHHLDCQK